MQVADILATAEPGVVVETVGGPAAVSHELAARRRLRGRAVHPRRRPPTGTSPPARRCRGPSTTSCCSTRSATTPSSTSPSSPTPGCRSPTTCRRVVVPAPLAGHDPGAGRGRCARTRVAADVHARAGRVVAEQTQLFDGTVPDHGPTRKGIAVSLGAQSPAGTLVVRRRHHATTAAPRRSRWPTSATDATRSQVHVRARRRTRRWRPQRVNVPARRRGRGRHRRTRVPIGADVRGHRDHASRSTAHVRRSSPRSLASWAPTSSSDRRGEHARARRSPRAAGSSRSPTSTPTRSLTVSTRAPTP